VSDHRDVREVLELAAVEVGGLERLEAGDTPEAAAVAGHLAGCPDCVEELARLRRASALLRPIVGGSPDPALRERTLANVRALGVPRGAPAEAPLTSWGTAGALPSSAGRPVPAPSTRRHRAWPAAVAAALVVGLAGGVLLAGGGPLAGPSGNSDPATAMEIVARETAALVEAGGAREVALLDAAGRPAGTLVLSPAEGRLVVTATGLEEPGPGAAYGYWVEVDGRRTLLATLWWAGEVAWWAGEAPLPLPLPPAARYGISLVGATASPGNEVLTSDR
jgi:anti-sigma factor RsiW